MSSTRNLDRVATALSLSCVAHCIALPLLAISLPILSLAAGAEWIHWALAALAIVSSGAVITTDGRARTPSFVVPASIGIFLITGALFVEKFGFDETPPTVIGGVLLAAAHIYRLFKHQ